MSSGRLYGDHYLTDEQSKLAGDNIKLVWWYLYRHAIKKNIIKAYEAEECEGYLMWHLCMAAEGFDVNRDKKFSTYAVKGLHSGLQRYLELKNRFNSRFILTDFVVKSGDKGAENERMSEPEYIPQSKKQIKWDDIKFLFDLIEMSPLEQQVFYFYYEQNYTFQKIGDLTKYTRERIRQIHGDVINKLKEAVNENDIKLIDFVN